VFHKEEEKRESKLKKNRVENPKLKKPKEIQMLYKKQLVKN